MAYGLWLMAHGSWLMAHEDTFNARADAAEELVRDGPDRRGRFAHADRFPLLLSDDHDLVARVHLEARHIDHRHIHAHRAHDGYAFSAYQHERAARHAPIQTVGVARGHDRDGARRIRDRMQTVARAFAGTHPLHMHDTTVE